MERKVREIALLEGNTGLPPLELQAQKLWPLSLVSKATIAQYQHINLNFLQLSQFAQIKFTIPQAERMGSSASKAASKTASRVSATNTARRYPTRTPPTSINTNTTTVSAQPSPPAFAPGPQVHPEVHASSTRGQTIDRDASDPSLAARLQQLGPVQPNPTQSNSSTVNSPQGTSSFQPSASTPSQSIFPNPASNPAVSLLTARYRLAEEAEKEFEGIGRRGASGRSFLDVTTLRQVLVLREKGMQEGEIERMLELKEGVVGRLGPKGIVGAT